MKQINPCPKCGSVETVKHGFVNDYQKYACKNCGAVFSDKPRKHSNEIKMKAIELYLNNTGIRKTAMFLQVSPPLILKWIKNMGKIMAEKLRDTAAKTEINEQTPDIIEMDEIYTYVKKNGRKLPYGLLILGDKVVLLRTTLDKE